MVSFRLQESGLSETMIETLGHSNQSEKEALPPITTKQVFSKLVDSEMQTAEYSSPLLKLDKAESTLFPEIKAPNP